MLTEQEIRKMIKQLRKFQRYSKKTREKNDIQKYREYELYCLKSLDYFILTKANKYRGFSNYEDLVQDAREALLKAINTFNLNKGSFFFWAGLFVNTRLSRSANNHTAVRYPMHYAKKFRPHKENKFPVMYDTKSSPEKNCETSEINELIYSAIKDLAPKEQELIKLIYGLDTGKPISITKICQKMKISRTACNKIITQAMETLREKIEL